MRGKALSQAFGKVNFPNGLFFRCLSPLSRKQSPVNVQGGAGDLAGLARGQKDHTGGDVFGCSHGF
jgi:hypothetical protein